MIFKRCFKHVCFSTSLLSSVERCSETFLFFCSLTLTCLYLKEQVIHSLTCRHLLLLICLIIRSQRGGKELKNAFPPWSPLPALSRVTPHQYRKLITHNDSPVSITHCDRQTAGSSNQSLWVWMTSPSFVYSDITSTHHTKGHILLCSHMYVMFRVLVGICHFHTK